MKALEKIHWEARRYYRLCFGIRLEQFVCSVRFRLVGRHVQAVRLWRALAYLPEFRPHRAVRQLQLLSFLCRVLVFAAIVFGPWLLCLLGACLLR